MKRIVISAIIAIGVHVFLLSANFNLPWSSVDLPEIPDNVKEGLEIIPVEHVSDVLKLALTGTPEPIEWDEAAEEAAAAARAAEATKDAPGAVTH